MDHPPLTVGELADHLRTLPPSCGSVRLIGIDGHAGSGKSTFATALATALGSAPVLHLDDLATHDSYFGWFERLRAQVLEPFTSGRPATYDVYDWEAAEFTSRRTLPVAPVALVEGVGAGRPALRPHLSALFWMEVARDEAWRRGRGRDGPALTDFWNRWTRAEIEHFAAEPAAPYADFRVAMQSSGDALVRRP